MRRTSLFGADITNFIGHRLFGGMGIGLASMLAPMYIAEIAPPSKRGALVTYQQIAIVSGITMSYFVNYFIKKFGGDGDPNWVHTEGWRWMLACCAIPAGIFVLLLFFVPETPRGLMLKGKERESARSAHQARQRGRSQDRPGGNRCLAEGDRRQAASPTAACCSSSASCCPYSSSWSASTRCSTTARRCSTTWASRATHRSPARSSWAS